MELKFEVTAKIQRPVAEVFEAVQNPEKLSGYFTTGGATGRLEQGAKVLWRFADYPGDIDVQVKEVMPNELIAFEWGAEDGGYNTRVEIRFQPLGERNTLVTISEGKWKNTPEGLKASYGNCQGWSQMSSCLKAYLEHGINLREGFY